jgi:mono/diheme cytochrome c family protein
VKGGHHVRLKNLSVNEEIRRSSIVCDHRAALLRLLAAVVLIAVVSVPPTVAGSEGVYTAEQAGRGQNVYVSKCSECHDGGIMGPELWGRDFMSAWDGKNVRSLFDAVKGTMPADTPGSLSERDALDVVAYILQENGQPAGESPLVAAVPLDVTITRGSK